MRDEFEKWFPEKRFRRLVSDERYESMEVEWAYRGYVAGALAMREQCQRERLQERLGDRAKGPVNVDDCGVPHLREE